MDDYQKAGKYVVYGTIAQSIANRPFDTAYRFFVIRFDSWVVQIAMNVGNNDTPDIKYRRFDEGNKRSAWAQLAKA